MSSGERYPSGGHESSNDKSESLQEENEDSENDLIDNLVGDALRGSRLSGSHNTIGGKRPRASCVGLEHGLNVAEERSLVKELFRPHTGDTGVKAETQHMNLNRIVAALFLEDTITATITSASNSTRSVIPASVGKSYLWLHKRASKIVKHNAFFGFFMVLTFYAIFGPDLVLLFLDKDVDFGFQIANTVVFFLFVIELIVQVFGTYGYMLTVTFLLDVVSILSILSDTYLLHAVSVDEEGARISRMARSSRMTRLARIVRVARFTRLLPGLMRLCGNEGQKLGKSIVERRLWRSFLYLDQDHDGLVNYFDAKCWYVAVLCEGSHMLESTKEELLRADMQLLCRTDADQPAATLNFSEFKRLIFSLQLGQNLVSWHLADVNAEDGVWRLTQKLSDKTALKVCIGLLALVTVIMILAENVKDGGPSQGLGQLEEIAKIEKSSGTMTSSYLCDQISEYASSYSVMYIFLNEATYFQNGKCIAEGIARHLMDPWDRIKDIVKDSALRDSEVLRSCWGDLDECRKDHTTSISLVDISKETQETLASSLLMAAIVIILLLVFVYALNTGITNFSKTLLQPLRALVDDMSAMSHLELVNIDREMPLQEGGKRIRVAEELQQLQESCNTMRGAIKSWSKYVPPAVVQRLFKAGVEATIGVSRVDVTILFCDIKGFEDKVRGLSPGDVLEVLSQALNGVALVIARHKGTLLEFIGDEVLAVFNAPNSLRNHTYAGVVSALEIHSDVASMPPIKSSDGREISFSCRCGVNTCKILAGNIGSAQRMKYGLLGDGINLTARLKGINSKYGTGTLCPEVVFIEDTIQRFVVGRPVDLVAVKGKKEPTAVFEPVQLRDSKHRLSMDNRLQFGGSIRSSEGSDSVMSHTEQNDEEEVSPIEDIMDKHSQAFNLYRERRFTEAAELFEQVFKFFAAEGRADEPSRILLERCQRYAKEPPPPEWDGVERLTKK